jgi:dihydropteroate synthase
LNLSKLMVIQSSKLNITNLRKSWGKRTYIMGILNITPDSFSGDGLLEELSSSTSPIRSQEASIEAAINQAQQFVTAGADILDVGGESTRPGADPISTEEEIDRVIPVIRALVDVFDVIVSIDTYKSEVAQAALEVGARMVNDVWGLKADPQLGRTVAEYDVPIILMHNRSSWAHAQIKEQLGGRYVGVPYENLLDDIRKDLLESISIAHQSGIKDHHIILDPGIGFGKTVEQNLELLDRLEELKLLGYPILLGASRKSFIGYTLNLPPDNRLEGTAAAVSVGIVRGADLVRVHDVEFMSRVVQMTDAIVRRD